MFKGQGSNRPAGEYMGISGKIWLGIIILVVAYLVTVAVGFVNGDRTETALVELRDGLFPAVVTANDVRSSFNEGMKGYEEAFLADEENEVKLQTANQTMDTMLAEITSLTKTAGLSEDSQATCKRLLDSLKTWVADAKNVYTKMIVDGDIDMNATERLRLEHQSLVERLGTMIASIQSDATALFNNLAKQSQFQRWASLVGSIVALAVVIIVTLVVLRTQVIGPLYRVMSGLNNGSQSIGSASSEMSNSASQLAESATEQAEAMERIGKTLDRIANLAAKNSDDARSADEVMKNAQQIVKESESAMRALSDAIGEIASTSAGAVKIIGTIEDIAFQTNLLALNAAVEAARAGEAGAGFAVVAEEVRNLASRAATAAKDTADSIQRTQGTVTTGRELATRANEAFGSLISSTEQIAGLVDQVAQSSQEQRSGLEEINQMVGDVDRSVERNAAAAQEAASASEHLETQAADIAEYAQTLTRMLAASESRYGSSTNPPLLDHHTRSNAS